MKKEIVKRLLAFALAFVMVATTVISSNVITASASTAVPENTENGTEDQFSGAIEVTVGTNENLTSGVDSPIWYKFTPKTSAEYTFSHYNRHTVVYDPSTDSETTISWSGAIDLIGGQTYYIGYEGDILDYDEEKLETFNLVIKEKPYIKSLKVEPKKELYVDGEDIFEYDMKVTVTYEDSSKTSEIATFQSTTYTYEDSYGNRISVRKKKGEDANTYIVKVYEGRYESTATASAECEVTVKALTDIAINNVLKEGDNQIHASKYAYDWYTLEVAKTGTYRVDPIGDIIVYESDRTTEVKDSGFDYNDYRLTEGKKYVVGIKGGVFEDNEEGDGLGDYVLDYVTKVRYSPAVKSIELSGVNDQMISPLDNVRNLGGNLKITYEDGKTETIKAGDSDSFGNFYNTKVISASGRDHGTGRDLTAGTYKLYYYSMGGDNSVSSNEVTFTVVDVKNADLAELPEEGTMQVTVPEEGYVWYEYTPSETGPFKLVGGEEIKVYEIVDNWRELVAEGSDQCIANMESGKTYYIRIKGDAGTYPFSVTALPAMKEICIPLELGVDASVSLTKNMPYAYFSYTVPEGQSDRYTFASYIANSSCLPEAILYDSEGKELSRDSYSGAGLNFQIEYNFEAGKTYYMMVSFDEQETGIVTVRLDKGRVNNNDVHTHSWDAGTIVVKPGCETEGSKQYTCTECKQTTTLVAEALGHIFGKWVVTKAATATENGSKERVCTGCSIKETEVIPATGETVPGGTTPPGGSTVPGETTNPDGTTTPGSCILTEEEKEVAEKLGLTDAGAKELNEFITTNGISKDVIYVTEDSITSQTSEDVSVATYNLLQAKATKATKNSIKIKWKKLEIADGYMVFGNKCGKANKYELIKVLGKNAKSFTQKKLKKGTFYKYLVVAYKLIDGKRVTIATAKTIHEVTAGGKYGNAKAVKVKKAKLTVKVKKKVTIKASEVKKDKKLKKHRKLAFESSNPSIATVNKKGKVTGKKKGTCYIYVYAQNGVFKKVKITVKK